MKLAERTLAEQRKILQSVNNKKFKKNGNEYVIRYSEGIADYISVWGRNRPTAKYMFVNGFYGYKEHSAEDIISKAIASV